jgi:hypothetical protein
MCSNSLSLAREEVEDVLVVDGRLEVELVWRELMCQTQGLAYG